MGVDHLLLTRGRRLVEVLADGPDEVARHDPADNEAAL
jgi:hypothetical protein